MSAALYIVLEDDDPAFETDVDGKALSNAETELQVLAQRLGVTPLMEFFSMDPEDMLAEAEGSTPASLKTKCPQRNGF